MNSQVCIHGNLRRQCEMCDMVDEVSSLTAALAACEKERDEARDLSYRRLREAQNLQHDLAAARAELADLRDACTQQQEIINAHAAAYAAAVLESGRLRTENEALRAGAGNFSKLVARLSQRYIEVHAENEALKSCACSSCNQEILHLRTENEALRADAAALYELAEGELAYRVDARANELRDKYGPRTEFVLAAQIEQMDNEGRATAEEDYDPAASKDHGEARRSVLVVSSEQRTMSDDPWEMLNCQDGEIDRLRARVEVLEKALKVIWTWATCDALDRSHVADLASGALGKREG